MGSSGEPHVDTAALLAAIVQSTSDAILATDLTQTITFWNRSAERLYGYAAAEAIGRSNRLIIPPDRYEEEDDVLRRVRAGEPATHVDTVRVRKDGTRIEVSITASPIRDQDGHIIGISKIARDISQRRDTERDVARLAAIVEGSDDAIVAKDLTGVITSWNRAAERIFGYSAAEAVGQSILLIIPEDRHDEERQVLARIRRGEAVKHFETVRRRKDGTLFPVALTISPIRNLAGTIIGASKIARDISDRKRAEAEAQIAHARTTFLAHATEALSRSLDYYTTLKAIAELAVPDIADWCAVDIKENDNRISRLAVAHVDPAKVEFAQELRRRYEDPASPTSPASVIRTGIPAMIPEVTDAMIVAAAKGDEERVRLVRSLGLLSYICVPLSVGEETLGALTFATSTSGRRYSDEDLRFAEHVASRAALAVGNARAYEYLQRANRLKDEFLATLSHELRTPLNAILGYSRMLRGGLLAGDRFTRALETIERNTTALTQMIEDILDVSRIVSGSTRLNVQPVDLGLVLHESVETVLPAAEAKRIRVQTVIDPHVGPVAGDPDRLRQVVWNLLSNAVKFTPRDGRVQARLERVNSNAEIVVSDTGIGIDADFLPHVFERFRQADSSTTRQHSGLGLGLSIVRSLVELHGGTVHAASGGKNLGATFRVSLPLMIVHPEPHVEKERVHPRQEQPASSTDLPDLRGTHVFAVDDEPDALMLLKEILESAGARVTTAASAAAALDTIGPVRPDVLVADLGMPQMDGFQLIERVRRSNDPAVRDVPAAALTAYARSEDRARVLQSGFEMHLAKPIDPIELVSAVKALARRRAAMK
jgi:PAS domain S-box-containing protein